MKIGYARERLADILDEVRPLVQAQYEEIGQPGLTFDPDWPQLLALEEAGCLVILTVRAEGALVGYAAYLVRRHLHYRETVAVNDVVYLAQAHRRGGIGLKLLRLADAALKARGAAKVYYHVKLLHPALGELLTRLGYADEERMLARRVC